MLAATLEAMLTGDELLDQGDIGPAELIDGRITPMSPTQNLHAYIVFEIGRRLGNFNAARRLGWVIGAESGVYTSRQPDTVRAMDVAFVSRRRLPVLERGFLRVAPELVVEVVSPTDRWSELEAKLAEYFAIGVDVVWVVAPERRSVLVYRGGLGPEALGEDDILRGEGLLAGLEIPLAELFATE
jgi:Uma2 family endonuclease